MACPGGKQLLCWVAVLALAAGVQGLDEGHRDCSSEAVASGACGGPARPAEHLLLQTRGALHRSDAIENTTRRLTVNLTSNCRRKLGHGGTHAAACLLVRGNRFMMVRVPYGRAPGWDFPGGHSHRGEAPCETAEREACEETGFGVKAYRKLSYFVYKCRITGYNVCTRPVDEGFLRKRWFTLGQVHHLHMRRNGWTWGNMRAIIYNNVRASLSEINATVSVSEGNATVDTEEDEAAENDLVWED